MPEIQMPKLSDTMTEGTLVAWKKKKGDKVSAGEVIAEIETDKATMEWESPEDGTLTDIFVEEGGKVNVGDKIAFIGEEGEEASTSEKEKPKEEEKKTAGRNGETSARERKKERNCAAATTEEREEDETQASTATGQGEARVKASPVARRVAAELGVDLTSIKGTGPDGRVTETDVRAAAKSKGGAPQKTSAPAVSSPIKAGAGNAHQSFRNAQRHRGTSRRKQSAGSAFLSQHRYRRRAAHGCARGIEIGRGRRRCLENHSE